MNEQNDAPKLPKGWTVTTLDKTCKIIRGVSFPSDAKRFEPENNYVTCLRTANVQKQVDWKSLWFIPSAYVKRDEQFIQPFDILISTANSFELVGKVAQIKEIPHKSTLGAFISMFRVFPEMNPQFVYYQLASTDCQEKIRSYASTTTNISNVSTAKLAELSFLIPPLNEQARIVAKVEELFTKLDAGIDALRAVRKQLKRYRQAVLRDAVTGELTKLWRIAENGLRVEETGAQLLRRILQERRTRWQTEQLAKFAATGKTPKNDDWKNKYKEPAAPDTENLPELPESWTWATIDQLTELVTKGSSPNWQGFDYLSEGISFVRSQNVLWGSIDLTDVAYLSPRFNEKETKSVIKTNDVLLNIVGASIGRAALATESASGGNMNQAVSLIRLIETGFIPKLLVLILISPDIQSAINLEKVDVARANLSLDDVKNISIPLPPLAEQQKIVEEVERLLSVADAVEATIEQSLKQAARLRQSILKRAFAGELVAQDDADEPAAVLLERIKHERSAQRETAKPKHKTLQKKLF